VQRLKAAVPAPGEATARWELASGLLERLGAPLGATSAREILVLLAKETPGYEGLDFRGVGAQGRALETDAETPTAAQEEARA
jgi:predicted molibdopterin-dependent oxidoreductase YjgC